MLDTVRTVRYVIVPVPVQKALQSCSIKKEFFFSKPATIFNCLILLRDTCKLPEALKMFNMN